MEITAPKANLDGPKNNFRFNDLIFDVPPEQISIDHLDSVHQWSTLRARNTTKVPTGQGDLTILTTLTVLPHEMWKLHRLIQEFKFTPFWQIENNYVRSQVVPGLPLHYSMAVCASHMSVTTIPNNPLSWEVTLTLTWFNYFPFTKNLQYKRDWFVDIDGKRRTIYDIEFTEEELGEDFDGDGYINSGNEEILDAEDVVQTTYGLKKYNGYGISPEAVSMDALDLGDLGPKLWTDPPAQPVDAHHSNTYITYLNYLQAQKIEEDFSSITAVQDVKDGKGYREDNAFAIPYPGLASRLPETVSFTYREYMVYEPPDAIADIFAAAARAVGRRTDQDNVMSVKSNGKWATDGRKDGFSGHDKNGLTLKNYQDYAEKQADHFLGAEQVEMFMKLIWSESKWKHWGGRGSGSDPKGLTRSPTGARGIAQFVHKTIVGWGGNWPAGVAARTGHGSEDAFLEDVYANIRGAAMELQEINTRVGGDWVTTIAAYNWGEGTLKGWEGSEREGLPSLINKDGSVDWMGLREETQDYIKKITGQSPEALSPQETFNAGIKQLDIEDAEYYSNQSDNLYHGERYIDKITGEEYEHFEMTDEIANTLNEEIEELSHPSDGGPGWTYYASPHVSNVFYREHSIMVNNSELAPEGELVFDSQGFTISNHFAKMPLLSWEFPTYQYMGGGDIRFYFSFASINNKHPDTLSVQAQQLAHMKNTLETNGRLFRFIPDSWAARCSGANTRLLGEDSIIVNRLRSESVPGNPGLYAIDVEAEVAGPLVVESLQSDVQGDRSTLYKDLTERALQYITGAHIRTLCTIDVGFKRKAPYEPIMFGLLTKNTGDYLGPLSADTTEVFKITHDSPEEKISDQTNYDFDKDLDAIIQQTESRYVSQQGWGENRASEERVISTRGWLKYVPGLKAPFVKPWDAVFVNNADMTSDPQLFTAVEMIARVVRLMSYALSHEGYGGLSLSEIKQEDLLGIEKFILPVFESHDWGFHHNVKLFEVDEYVIGEQVSSVDPLTLTTLPTYAYRLKAERVGPMVNAAQKLTGYKRIGTPYGSLTKGLEFAFTGGAANAVNYLSNPLNENASGTDMATIVAQGRANWFWANKDVERSMLQDLKELVLYPALQVIYESKELRTHPVFRDIFTKHNISSAAARPSTYPDLPLPPHPYFKQVHYTEPDFYFYNDGDEGDEDLEPGENSQWMVQMNAMIDQAYDSYKKFSDGNVDGPRQHVTDEDPEPHNYESEPVGSDFPLSTAKGAKQSVINRYRSAEIAKQLETINNLTPTPAGHFAVRNIIKNPVQDALFGEMDIDAGFDTESLHTLALEASTDILSYKQCMRRAFPAFRVEFISEPDEQQLWQVYSKASSYAGVMDITITRNKYVPADLAVVRLQNISGVLDGSLLGATADVAYNSPARSPEDLNKPENIRLEHYKQHIYDGTPMDHFFNSIVVRAGLGIRIKLGYSSDHRNMDTRFVGRVVEVQPSSNSDSLTLICQSYGTELVQGIKGVTGVGEDEVQKLYGIKDPTLTWAISYPNTYKVVSAALSAPEVLHFGRRKLNAKFMPGEALDSDNDDELYTRGWKWKHLSPFIRGDVSVQAANDLYDNVSGNIPTQVVQKTINASESATGKDLSQFKGVEIGWARAGGGTAAGLFIFPPLGAGIIAWPFMKKMFDDKKNELIQNPVDDNIYVPNPDDYVIYGWSDPTGTIKDTDINYAFTRTTIWDTLQEMCLRHPGWVVSPQPYGNRMTLFFGVPSQRYWARPADTAFMDEMEEAHNRVTDFIQDIKTNPNSTAATNSSMVGPIEASLDVLVAGYNLRFRPFRRYHMLTSKHDIISNSISASSRNTFNTVIVRYNSKGLVELPQGPIWHPSGLVNKMIIKRQTANRKKDSYIVKLNPSMEDHEIDAEQISFPNCNGEGLAHRYGLATLCKGLAAMYQGELVTMSTTRIKPHDLCFILDEYNDMAGPIIVKEVTTTISPMHGMIDTIVPEAFVTTNEISSKCILDGLRSVIMRKAGMAWSNTVQSVTQLASTGFAASGMASSTHISGKAPIISNLVGAIQGGVEYHFFTKKKNSAVIVPLTKYGEPMTAGIPTDMVDSIWHNFRGQLQLMIYDAAQGHKELMYTSIMQQFRSFDPWDGTFRSGAMKLDFWNDKTSAKEDNLETLRGY